MLRIITSRLTIATSYAGTGSAKSIASPSPRTELLQGKNVILIGYKLLPGNANNRPAMIAVLNEIKQDYEVSRVIMVTDK